VRVRDENNASRRTAGVEIFWARLKGAGGIRILPPAGGSTPSERQDLRPVEVELPPRQPDSGYKRPKKSKQNWVSSAY
jgi:hypothetical protein